MKVSGQLLSMPVLVDESDSSSESNETIVTGRVLQKTPIVEIFKNYFP
jgi:hypothetical protein